MQGNVAEATGDNIFLVKDGEVSTPPTSEGALPGITRQAVMDLAKDLGIVCRQSVMTLYDVYNARRGIFDRHGGRSDPDDLLRRTGDWQRQTGACDGARHRRVPQIDSD